MFMLKRVEEQIMKGKMLESKIRIITVSLIAVSLTLHVIAISVIGYLGVEVSRHNERIEQLTQIANEKFEELFNFRKDSLKRAETANDQLRTLKETTDKNSARLDKTVGSSVWLKQQTNKIWRIGCPLGGMSNGSKCYVLEREKSNYTEAVQNCKDKGGELAILESQEVLDRLYEKFPTESYFVDARYDETLDKWKTSKGTDATFLPPKITQHQSSNGSCVYGHRKNFNRWHCYARMHYLCAF